MTTRTEVRETLHRWHPRWKLCVTWAAESVERDADGRPLWTYERTDEADRDLWEARRSGCDVPVIYPSLAKARAATASGAAAACLDRAIVQMEVSR